MSITSPTLLTSGKSQTSGSGQDTASIDPAAGSLVIVFQWTGSVVGGTAPTLADPTTTIPGLTLTQAATATADTVGRDWAGAIWWGIRSGTGAGTITLRAAASQPRWAWHVIEIASGFKSAAPFRQAEGSNGATATALVAFPQAPLDTSLAFACVASAGKNDTFFTSTPGWTWVLRGPMIESTTSTLATTVSTSSPPPSDIQWESLGTAGNIFFMLEVEAEAAAPVTTRVHRALLL